MTDKTMSAIDLLALAERCEAATGPDWELDAEIHRACGLNLHASQISYTASVDAALTLVPEGALWEAEHKLNIGTGELYECPEGEPRTDHRAGVGVGDVPAQWSYGRSLATPALAICAAALRARASLENGHG